MNLDLINEYCLNKQCVLPNRQNNSIEDIARFHVGLHSARIMTPYQTLCSRVKNFKPNLLIDQLYFERKIIKIRCMRTTLHIVPLDLASIVHNATINLRLSECNLFFRRNNVPADFVNDVKFLIEEILINPLTANKIELEIYKEIKSNDEVFKKQLSKKLLKYYWENGLLCYVNNATDWEKEERCYALTKRFYPNLNLNEYNSETAKEKLVLEYIKRYGPATLQDLLWWSGLDVSSVKIILNKYRDQIANFNVENFNFYILQDEFNSLIHYKQLSEDWVALLAYEDPALKGYYESRRRYVSQEFYNLLFNQIGEVRSSILYNGKAIGVWDWNKKDKRININLFTNTSKNVKDQIALKKKQYEAMLCSNQQISLWDN